MKNEDRKKEQDVVVEFDPESVDFEYLKKRRFDQNLSPLNGFIKIWHGTITKCQIKELRQKDWVVAVDKFEGISVS